VPLAARMKQSAGRGCRDAERERRVRERAQRVGAGLGLPAASTERLLALLIADALELQGWRAEDENCSTNDLDQGAGTVGTRMLLPDMSPDPSPTTSAWLRFLPPPWRWRPLLSRLPHSLQAPCLAAAAQRVLAAALAGGHFDLIEDRRIGIEVEDLGLLWTFRVRARELQVCAPGEAAEAIVRGSATDLLLLASRREDADTLFFQRRLVLAGDVELGLTARNLLDQLPWEQVPLGLRILVHRGAGVLQQARAAHSRA